MLNNLTNIFNLIKTRMVKTVLEDTDLFVVGTRDGSYTGNYKPTVAPLSVVAQAVIAQIPPTPPGLYGLYTQTESSTPIANTTVESSLIGAGVGSLLVPANGFSVGDSFHAKLIGHISCNGAATIRFKIKSGSVILADTGVVDLDASTNRHWEINVYFTIRELGGAGTASIASGGIFSYVKNSGVNFEGTNFSIINDTTFDTTTANTLSVTAEWGSANIADSIYSEIFTLTKTY